MNKWGIPDWLEKDTVAQVVKEALRDLAKLDF